MRNIKFRGKIINSSPDLNGSWTYGNLFISDWGEFFIGKLSLKTQKVGAEIFQVDEKTVGQFIGLLDLNGREIYEGDTFYYLNLKRQIKFNVEKSSWIGSALNSNLKEFDFYLRNLFNENLKRLNIEIVGDIY